MRAVLLRGRGGNDQVSLVERPVPVRQPGEVLIRVVAASVNRVDLYMRDSGAGITHSLPQIMGVDGAGIVEEVDSQQTHLKVGDRVALHPATVCGLCEFCKKGEQILCTSIRFLGEHRDGTFCQFVAVPAANAFALPDSLGFREGAALGVAYLTAWRMLFTKARLQPGETVLIFGIGGGVSLAAMQLAKLAGATVIVTSRDAGKLAKATKLGADHSILGVDGLAAAVLNLTGGRGVDVVIENVGQAVWPEALRSTARGGRIVTCGATSGDRPSADLKRLFVRQLQIFGSTLGTFGEFQDLLRFCGSTGLAPVIDTAYPLEQVHVALDRLERGDQFGKICLDIPE
ncbi:zinc-binding dehydrogenase [Pseudomonas sp. PCH199]|uniref:zinc-binding dehydrogenase n=1 Tax=unclassified Pseudomonas TaxID=196821 RepID=UPI000BC40A42|nr:MULTISPECIES: zinc-binding dehydrogenase [unclassified Pseudomonas]MCW8278457.1 zinc-binding dehydrogenase [Pseudomonas sp. PCH199]PAM81384.1 NADPH:quinone reductase [Pseudomonas sp. ERMR1:02]